MHFTQSTDRDHQSRKQLCCLKLSSARGTVSSVILQSSSSTEGLPDSLPEEFDPSSGICLPHSTPWRAVSLSCRRYPYAWNGQAGSMGERGAHWGPSKHRRSLSAVRLALQGRRGIPENPELTTFLSSEETIQPFRSSFCICPCTYTCKGEWCSFLSPMSVIPYSCHLAGLQLVWLALPLTDRWLVTQFSGRT